MKFDSPFDIQYPKHYRISNAILSDTLSVVEVGYNQVPPGLKQILKRDVYILHYVTAGKGKFQEDGFDKNYGYIVVPDELEIVEGDRKYPYETYWIMFRGSAAVPLLKKGNLPLHNGVFLFDKTKECSEIIKKVLFDIHPKNEAEEACLMQSALYQILALHMQDSKDSCNTLSIAHQVKQLIQQQYHLPIKIETIAQNFNFTRNYLSAMFKKEYHISPQEYLLTLRIEKAKQLLADQTKNLSVSEISFAVGYQDPLYFSRLFFKKVGVAPSTYKKITNSK